MNTKGIGIGSLAAVLLATLLSACANAPVAGQPGAGLAAAQTYSHDAYFY
jgi:hypothetical protein